MTSIISYNVNGIRAAQKKGFLDWLREEDPNVLCIQETKAQIEQVDAELATPEGYHTYWHSAEKKGYSGVAIYSKEEPSHVEVGFGFPEHDREGRVLRADYDTYSVMSVYLPSGSSGEHRQKAKESFLQDFLPYIRDLKEQIPNLIITGDFNICHTQIDIHDPVSNKHSSGFLPHEREWVTAFLNLGLVDTFREFNSEGGNYTWWSYRARSRERNKGWRIDYHFATEAMKDQLAGYEILKDVHHSDHCPIKLVLAS